MYAVWAECRVCVLRELSGADMSVNGDLWG